MKNKIYRLYVEKKANYDVEGKKILRDIKINLGISGLDGLRLVSRYDIMGISEEQYLKSRNTIFSEPTVDDIYDEELDIKSGEIMFAIEFLPGQYDQRADSAAQCIQILTQMDKHIVKTARIIILSGNITKIELNKIKEYCINAVDSREASLEKQKDLEQSYKKPEQVKVVESFINKSDMELAEFLKENGLAMSFEDLKYCSEYFRETEKRNPTITEIKVIDTYWSDHCRHTTFNTVIEDVSFEDGKYAEPIKMAYSEYLDTREFVYGTTSRDVTLMDMAVIGMKDLRKQGKLQDLDVSDEINACSIVVEANIDGEKEKWLVMFKNETHNHPTEIEPFGGAATCLGGSIRDPLSGRSYVYQAMRVTGSGDPRTKISDTIKGKLPQRKITLEAAHGFSSYGNQIGLATGLVSEIYDEGFVAKRMEVGAVIGAAPYKNVIREEPLATDVVILLGGKTGRDGCGGATGSSKQHSESSILTSGAEVQKGNAPTERKIQRLFRNPKVTTLIKRCNDFGAGGVSVAIGELADALIINLDKVTKKYDGLDGTELAISESQERMAVVVRKSDVDVFIKLSQEENLEAVEVAQITDDNRLKMIWKGETIVDVSRSFLDTNGVKQHANIKVTAPKESEFYFSKVTKDKLDKSKSIKELWNDTLSDLNICSNKGLAERFDSTIGAGTVLMPFGGKFQKTPIQSMVAKLPVLHGDTNTGTIMSYGYNPKLSYWSPFHGAAYAVIDSVTKVVASGADYENIKLTFQEYFEKLSKEPQKWGKPFSSLLGAFHVQKQFSIAAIGGKDSMSGTFNDMNVPPTLVSFAVDVINTDKVISPEFKKGDSEVVLIYSNINEDGLPDFEKLRTNYKLVKKLIDSGKVLSTYAVGMGGIASAISKMCFGNNIGFTFQNDIKAESLFNEDYGSIVMEIDNVTLVELNKDNLNIKMLGHTNVEPLIKVLGETISLEEALISWEGTLESVFSTKVNNTKDDAAKEVAISENIISYKNDVNAKNTKTIYTNSIKIAKPRVIIPVFPGTNCEYDSMRAFEKAGAQVEVMVLNNLSSSNIEESIKVIADKIRNSQIVMLPGGFSAGDEPDGSGKFIATFFRNPIIRESINELLQNRDGLMLGICNGFQALIKLGLVPYGKITDITKDSPTLTYNEIGRHISCMVQTKVVSTLSPWLSNLKVGDVHSIPVSHGEGRFVASDDVIKKLFESGQVATQYVDFNGIPSNDINFNPNGSMHAIEGITSLDGRVFGKMGHSERVGENIGINIVGNKDQKIFEAGVNYFK
ncbi:phosphoribosylformylglycinamidine synthase [Clostridium lacusfryxellense]|uniref:phosphoribosylformylglycinamidine synthase n=1 Tax=Clostridium lacusfryxellense TaxID=205328 RepID=UPI001C0E4069|nr:phosphoribosylformylglycinamidine synthase [Clostridium lacusfryxellense]MBU3112600.1 phosphoribosylformylglycinamidine synthase [Clostridium lacusfryxellense]